MKLPPSQIKFLQNRRRHALKRARAAIKNATAKEKRTAIEAVLRHSRDNDVTIQICAQRDTPREKPHLSVIFHSRSETPAELFTRFTKKEALHLLGFSWRKLGL